MKLVVVGGSAYSTPHLADALGESPWASEIDLVLVGREPRRLDAVARACTLIVPPSRLRITTNEMHTLAEALVGATVVLIQARYGGLEGRNFDETFSLIHDIPGDEGLGAGGLASAWRSWPHVDRLLEQIAASAPNAVVACMTAPLGIIVRAAAIRHPDRHVIGLCELPFTTLRDACRRFGVSCGGAAFDYAGINHLGVFDAIMCSGVDVVSAWESFEPLDRFPSVELVRRLGAVPLKYLRLHYHRAEVVREQLAKEPRSRVLERIATRSFAAFEQGGIEAIRDALRERDAPWYRDAVVPFLGALAGADTAGPMFLSTRNAGYLPTFADDDILEIPFEARDGKLYRRERSRPLAGPWQHDLGQLVRYERLATRAVLDRSRTALADALAIHPWVDGRADVAALVEAICAC